MQRQPLPRLYAILDAGFTAARGLDLWHVAHDFRQAGVTLLQYRDKTSPATEILANARRLREIFPAPQCTLILNDWPQLAVEARYDGVHVGQGDISVSEARQIVGPDRIVGVSTHTAEQVVAADRTSADYIAIGPIFSTSTKLNPDPEVGLEGLRSARLLTSKLLVAIGGIRRSDSQSVIDAGADSVAIISDLLVNPEAIETTISGFIRELT